jgi:hypothetical protein
MILFLLILLQLSAEVSRLYKMNISTMQELSLLKWKSQYKGVQKPSKKEEKDTQ